MKAKTTRPLLILLLFGFLPTTGWMIVRGGADSSGAQALARSCPVSRASHVCRATARPWPASDSHVHASPRARTHARPTASARPGERQTQSEPDPASAADPDRGADTLDPSTATAGNGGYLADTSYEAGDGFGDFGIPQGIVGGSSRPGILPANRSGGPGATVLPGASGSPGAVSSSHSTSSDPSSGGSPSRTTTGINLQSPPAGTTVPPSAQSPSDGAGPTITAPEPSTLALCLVGMAAIVGRALRRRRVRAAQRSRSLM